MRIKLLAGALAVVVVAVAAWVGVSVLHSGHKTPFQQAVSDVPAATKRLSFTDWEAIRARLGVPSATSGARLSSWLDKAYDRDFSATSGIKDEGVSLQKHFGFSPANASWEAYAQSSVGATVVLKMEPDVDLDGIATKLQGLRFKKPKTDDGVWKGGPDLVSTIDPELSPEVQYVVLLRKQHLIVTSDTPSYAEAAAQVAEGKADSLAHAVSNTSSLAGTVSDPVTAELWARDFACSDLAMSQASDADQKQAAQLIAQAGHTSALSGLVMSMSATRLLTVAEEFESGSQARENLTARAKLAVGVAVGRGGDTFASDFKLLSARTKGSTVLLLLKPRDPDEFVISSVYDGPVIFATC